MNKAKIEYSDSLMEKCDNCLCIQCVQLIDEARCACDGYNTEQSMGQCITPIMECEDFIKIEN
jgi:hypothetical protein